MPFTREVAEEITSCVSNSDLVTVHGLRVMGTLGVGFNCSGEVAAERGFKLPRELCALRNLVTFEDNN